MNMIEHWAHLIDESYKPDSYKQDDLDRNGDRWEEMQKELAEINKKLDRKGLKEAEDDEEDLGEPFEDDPEFRKMMDKADIGIAQRKSASDRNERISSGQKNDTDAEYDALSDEDKKKAMAGKMFFVHEIVDEYEFGNTKADIEKAQDMDDVANLKPGITKHNRIETKVFENEDEAKEYVRREIGRYSQKYGITADDFKRLHQKVEIKHSWTEKDEQSQDSSDRKTNRKKVEVSAIPASILAVDPNAFGFLYASASTDGDGKVYGVNREGMFTKDDEREDFNQLLIEFICYSSFFPVPSDSGYMDLHDKIRKLHDPEYKTNEEIRKQKEREHDQMIADLEEEMFDTTLDYIERFIATEDDEVTLEVLRPYFKGMKDEDILNLDAEALRKLGKQKVFNVRNGIWRYQDKEDAADSAERMKIDTDDEIENAEKQDKSYSNRSVDGYATRSDDENAKDADSESDVEDDEPESRTDSRKDDDMDDYEGSQNNTDVKYGKTSSGSQKGDSSLKLHGVKISKKVYDAWKGLKQEDKPKNAEEVKAFIKKVNDRDR